jgi:hypothetical protein
MTTIQIIETAREMLPYTSEFEHNVIRVPVGNPKPYDTDATGLPLNYRILAGKPFYEVEFRKQYIKNIAIGWEFVNIY